MFKYKDKEIFPGKGWKDDEGVRHPRNWNIWSSTEKKERGVVEITPDTPPDSRLYDWSKDSNGKITSTAKDLDAVKTEIKKEIKFQQFSELYISDWAYIRHYDTGTDVPANIETWRNAIRAKATEMENAIDSATDTDAVTALFISHDEDGKKSGILYDWPELEE
tara:strand:+ start:748 stop:1239 length:492 start_codon:yes stop_codon:yes gene_type:complete